MENPVSGSGFQKVLFGRTLAFANPPFFGTPCRYTHRVTNCAFHRKFSIINMNFHYFTYTRFIALGSNPIDSFVVVVAVSKLSLYLHEIVIDIVDSCPSLCMTRYSCLEMTVIVV